MNRWLILTIDCAQMHPKVSLREYQTEEKGGLIRWRHHFGVWNRRPKSSGISFFSMLQLKLGLDEKEEKELAQFCMHHQQELRQLVPYLEFPEIAERELSELIRCTDGEKMRTWGTLQQMQSVYEQTDGEVWKQVLGELDEYIQEQQEKDPGLQIRIFIRNRDDLPTGFLLEEQVRRFFRIASMDSRYIGEEAYQKETRYWQGMEQKGCLNLEELLPFSLGLSPNPEEPEVWEMQAGAPGKEKGSCRFRSCLLEDGWELWLNPRGESREGAGRLRDILEKKGLSRIRKNLGNGIFVGTPEAVYEGDSVLRISFAIENLWEPGADPVSVEIKLGPEDVF